MQDNNNQIGKIEFNQEVSRSFEGLVIEDLKYIRKKVDRMETEITTLKKQSSLWGAVSGGITAAITILGVLIFGKGN